MTTSVKLGVAFDLNGTPVTLEPKEAIDDIKQKGIELELPKRLELGKVGDGVDSILKQLGSNYRLNQETPSEAGVQIISIKEKLPDFSPLQNAYGKVETATLSVEKFHAKIPGQTDTKNGQTETKYTIGLSATWQLDGPETGLTLTGIYFEVSNEGTSQ